MTIGFPRSQWNLPGYLDAPHSFHPPLNLEREGQVNLLIKNDFPLTFMETVRWLIWEDHNPTDSLISKIAYWILGGDLKEGHPKRIQRSLNETPVDDYEENIISWVCNPDYFPTVNTPETNITAYDTEHPEYVAQRTYPIQNHSQYIFALRVALERYGRGSLTEYEQSVMHCYKREMEKKKLISMTNCTPEDHENYRCFEGLNENDIPVFCDPNILSTPPYDTIPVTPYVNDLDERHLFFVGGTIDEPVPIRLRFKFFAYNPMNNQTAYVPDGFTYSVPNERCYSLLNQVFSVIINNCSCEHECYLGERSIYRFTCYDPAHTATTTTTTLTSSSTTSTTQSQTTLYHSQSDWKGIVFLVSSFTFHFFAVFIYFTTRGAWKKIEIS